MQGNRKTHLNIVQPTPSRVVDGTTCFAEHAKNMVDCQRKRCPHWIDYAAGHNCVMIAAQDGQHTLQTIGQIYGLTRMRICQVEKAILDRIKQAA